MTAHAPTGPPAIHVRGLVKRFGDIEAVAGIDLDVHPGETFGFLGPNGAGKSTTINILCTLASATEGRAEVAGFDVRTHRDEVRRRIGLVFQDPTLDVYLSAEQNLRFHAELYGVPAATVDGRIDDVLRLVGLAERRTSPVRTFSGGMRRRLEIARGLLHAPEVLFLDEPTVGLDPQTRASIWEYLTELADDTGLTIFLTTHYLEEAENCDRIAIIDGGRIVALDTPDALKAAVGEDRIEIETDDDELARQRIGERFGIEPAPRAERVTFSVAAGEQFVPRLFAELGVPIRSVSVSRPSLDDVFMAHTGRTIRDAEAGGASANPFAMAARR
ncbi:MAG: ATP-binding cassette domain-containing protein [Acidimicrobiia bacterium]